MPEQAPVFIVGGGWAGLAAAVRLSQKGYTVNVLEAARQIGGRARRVPFNQRPVDNGQHLLLGAYHGILQLLDEIGVDKDQALYRHALQLQVRDLHGGVNKLSAPNLPAPLHLLGALLGAKGFSLRDRFRAASFGALLFMGRIELNTDISVGELLARYRQTPRLIKTFWEPLCLATLNTPLHEASAEVFLCVLRDAFLHQASDSDLLLPRQDLSSLFPEPAMDYIEQKGGSIRLGNRVSALDIQQGQIKALKLEDDYHAADQVVLATAPYATASLLEAHTDLHSIRSKLSKIQYQPICTVYLQYPRPLALKPPMQGVIGGHAQWIFDLQICQQPGLIAVVISSTGAHMDWDKKQLAQHIAEELAQLNPTWPPVEETFVIREKRATFSCHVDINRLRPGNQTPIQGLWLAGDYTATGYPATLEGAVRSGIQCADLISGRE